MKRRTFINFLAALGPGAATPAFAQEYPSRQLRLLVPYTAGGGTDLAVTHDEYQLMLQAERAKWERIIRANNIQMGS